MFCLFLLLDRQTSLWIFASISLTDLWNMKTQGNLARHQTFWCCASQRPERETRTGIFVNVDAKFVYYLQEGLFTLGARDLHVYRQRMYGNKQRQQTDFISAICVFLWMLKLKRDLQDGIWARAQSEIGLSPDFPFARLHISKVHMIFKEYHFARQHISKVIIIFKDYYILYF